MNKKVQNNKLTYINGSTKLKTLSSAFETKEELSNPLSISNSSIGNKFLKDFHKKDTLDSVKAKNNSSKGIQHIMSKEKDLLGSKESKNKIDFMIENINKLNLNAHASVQLINSNLEAVKLSSKRKRNTNINSNKDIIYPEYSASVEGLYIKNRKSEYSHVPENSNFNKMDLNELDLNNKIKKPEQLSMNLIQEHDFQDEIESKSIGKNSSQVIRNIITEGKNKKQVYSTLTSSGNSNLKLKSHATQTKSIEKNIFSKSLIGKNIEEKIKDFKKNNIKKETSSSVFLSEGPNRNQPQSPHNNDNGINSLASYMSNINTIDNDNIRKNKILSAMSYRRKEVVSPKNSIIIQNSDITSENIVVLKGISHSKFISKSPIKNTNYNKQYPLISNITKISKASDESKKKNLISVKNKNTKTHVAIFKDFNRSISSAANKIYHSIIHQSNHSQYTSSATNSKKISRLNLEKNNVFSLDKDKKRISFNNSTNNLDNLILTSTSPKVKKGKISYDPKEVLSKIAQLNNKKLNKLAKVVEELVNSSGGSYSSSVDKNLINNKYIKTDTLILQDKKFNNITKIDNRFNKFSTKISPPIKNLHTQVNSRLDAERSSSKKAKTINPFKSNRVNQFNNSNKTFTDTLITSQCKNFDNTISNSLKIIVYSNYLNDNKSGLNGITLYSLDDKIVDIQNCFIYNKDNDEISVDEESSICLPKTYIFNYNPSIISYIDIFSLGEDNAIEEVELSINDIDCDNTLYKICFKEKLTKSVSNRVSLINNKSKLIEKCFSTSESNSALLRELTYEIGETKENLDNLTTFSITISLLQNWGNQVYMGLTSLCLLDNNEEKIEIVKIFAENDKKDIKQLLNYTNQEESNNNYYWEAQLHRQNVNLIIEFTLKDNQELNGMLIKNYNKKHELDKGVKILQVTVNTNHHKTFVIRKGIGLINFDYSQKISFHDDLIKLKEDEVEPFENIQFPTIKQPFSPPYLPTGFKLEFYLMSNYGDINYIGLNQIEVFDQIGKDIFHNTKYSNFKIFACPEGIYKIPGMEDDKRRIENIVNTEGNKRSKIISANTTWITTYTKHMDNDNSHSYNRIILLFDNPISISYIRIWNYSKTPARGVREIKLYLDDTYIYCCDIKKSEENLFQSDDNCTSMIFSGNSKIITQNIINQLYFSDKILEYEERVICENHNNLDLGDLEEEKKSPYSRSIENQQVLMKNEPFSYSLINKEFNNQLENKTSSNDSKTIEIN